MMHSCMEWKEGCVHHTTRCLFTLTELFSRTFVALEILKNSDKQHNESGRIIYELKMKLGRTVTNITKLKETSFTMWHL